MQTAQPRDVGALVFVEVCNRWRVDENWWREPIARDYFKVVGTRWLALIYYDRLSRSWHLERLYD